MDANRCTSLLRQQGNVSLVASAVVSQEETRRVKKATDAQLTIDDSWDAKGELWPGRSAIQEVAEGVCITNFFGAKKLDLLTSQGITHVLICAAELREAFPHAFQYLKLMDFTDNTGTDLLRQLEVALPWIDRVVQAGGRVLLHCAAGSSRSGAVMVAYLMHAQKMPLAKALEFARQARPIIKPNPGILEQLEIWSSRRSRGNV